jgi:hypothetical protein
MVLYNSRHAKKYLVVQELVDLINERAEGGVQNSKNFIRKFTGSLGKLDIKPIIFSRLKRENSTGRWSVGVVLLGDFFHTECCKSNNINFN